MCECLVIPPKNLIYALMVLCVNIYLVTPLKDFNLIIVFALTAMETNRSECNDQDLQIVGSAREGRVEVCYNQAWGTICDEVYGLNAVRILCSQLGFRRK